MKLMCVSESSPQEEDADFTTDAYFNEPPSPCLKSEISSVFQMHDGVFVYIFPNLESQ